MAADNGRLKPETATNVKCPQRYSREQEIDLLAQALSSFGCTKEFDADARTACTWQDGG
jgi:hypothetical protein